MIKTQRGFTLIEILIAVTVSTMLMGALGTVFVQLLVVPKQQSDQLAAVNDLRLALDFIQYDGVQATGFTEQTDPDYGYFLWQDYSSEDNYKITYRYENSRLMRDESINGTQQSSLAIAFHVADYESITFFVNSGNNTVTVTMTISITTVMGKEILETDTRHIDMRAAQE